MTEIKREIDGLTMSFDGRYVRIEAGDAPAVQSHFLGVASMIHEFYGVKPAPEAPKPCVSCAAREAFYREHQSSLYIRGREEEHVDEIKRTLMVGK